MSQHPEKYLKHKTLKTFGLSEVQIRDLLKGVSRGHDLHIRLIVNLPGVDICITAESKVERIADSLLASAEKSIRNRSLCYKRLALAIGREPTIWEKLINSELLEEKKKQN